MSITKWLVGGLAAFALAAGGALAPASAQDKPVKIRVQSVIPKTADEVRMLEIFVENVKALTNGSVTFEVLPAGVVVAQLRASTVTAEVRRQLLSLAWYPLLALAVATLLSRESWTLALLQSVQSGEADATLIEPTRRALLVGHKNAEIAQRAGLLFAKSSPSARKDVLAAFAPALKQSGDPVRGIDVFNRLCMSCHRVGDRGQAVGPDLLDIRSNRRQLP